MKISKRSTNNGLDFIRYFLSLNGVESELVDDCGYLFVTFSDINKYREIAKDYQCVVFYDLFHLDDDLAEILPRQIAEFPHTNKIYLTVNANAPRSKEYLTLFWDVLLNRSKHVYFDPAINLNRVWYYASPRSYVVNDLHTRPRGKKFIYQCRSKNHYRIAMLDHVMLNEEHGYISSVFDNRVLASQDMQQQDWNVLDTNQGLYVPIHGSYYDDSYLSVYVESSFRNEHCVHVTEKTWEPLIKGHFILPFSNPGYISHLRDQGFRFPDFIDYSYDDVLDCEQRFELVQVEFDRLMTLDLNGLYNQNFDVILHNRHLIETMPYHKANFNDNSTI